MTTAILDEFQHEFEQEQTRRLRKRVYWYCLVNFAFGTLIVAISFLLRDFPSGGVREFFSWLATFTAIVFPTIYAGIEARDAHTHQRTRQEHLHRVSNYIAISGIVSALSIFVLGALTKAGISMGGLALQQLFSVAFSHFMACVFLPWNGRESLRPFIPMYLINAVGMAALWVIQRQSFSSFDVAFLLLYALGSVAVVMPGLGIAYWRNNRFAQEFTLKAVAGRYGEMRRELSGAQRIHEALFPAPETRGSIRFDYRYQPMRSIGGDYLYARYISTDDRSDPELLVLLLDVTGHGVPAALTVNRLYGELERLVAEHPTISPTGLLRSLNRYCHLTLMDHSLFVTACAFRINASKQSICYANAGHPPAFLLSHGLIRELEPTAMVLGVSKDLDVENEDPCLTFSPGDMLIAYTDGAMETRDKHGRMFNTDGIRDTLLASVGSACICHELLNAVTRHRYGPLTDDTLVVEIVRTAVPESDAPSQGDGSTNGEAPASAVVVPTTRTETVNTSGQ